MRNADDKEDLRLDRAWRIKTSSAVETVESQDEKGWEHVAEKAIAAENDGRES
jgi:hypothetical protein